MKKPIPIYFTLGQNKKMGQELMLAAGELASLVNADLSSLGIVRPSKSLSTSYTFSSNIHSLMSYPGGKVWVGEGTNLKEHDSVTNIYTTLAAARALGCDYDGWMYFGNGTDKKAFDISRPTTQAFDWSPSAPAGAPTVAEGAAGNPSGTYNCYFSYVAKYTDGSEYETELSPVGTVTVTAKKIEWSNMTASSDAQVTHKRLYRMVGGYIKYVTEITNATTTYSDDNTDATLTSNESFANTGYYPPPSGVWAVLEHYKRMFVLVTGSFSHCLFWSEEYIPRAFIYDTATGLYTNSSDIFRKGDPCTGMFVLGDNLHIAARNTFKILVGNNPSTWAIRPTAAQKGNVAKYGIQMTPYGALHVWWDGVYLFNGYNTHRITGQNTPFFNNINWTYVDTIFSAWDGAKYYLWVPYGAATAPDKCFVIDFDSYPKLRMYETTLGEDLALFDSVANTFWLADGVNLRKRTGTSAVAFEVWSKTIPTAALTDIEGADKLYYEANTNGESVTVTFYFDHSAHATTQTVTTSSRERGWISIPEKKARTMSIKLSGNLSNNVTIYEPWIIGGET